MSDGADNMKWHKHMTLSQRNKYNEYHRKLYLRKQLELGLVPQPRKPATWLLALYREYGVEHAVYFPQRWMDKQSLKTIKAESKKIRAQVRDSLPATASKSDVDAAVLKIIARRVIPKFISS